MSRWDAVMPWTIGGVCALLVVATTILFLLRKSHPSAEAKNNLLRVRTWWIISVCFFAGLLGGIVGLSILFGAVGALALREFVLLNPRFRNKRLTCSILITIVVAHYTALVTANDPVHTTAIVACFVGCLISVSLIWGEISRAGALAGIGYLFLILCLSHIVLLFNGIGGGGIVVAVVLLTSLNDVFQYIWGKTTGKRAIVPKISPNKTWEGFIGGVVSTSILSGLITPLLCELPIAASVVIGLFIGVAGFLGDITFSAYKRHVDAKDSGSILPGHGGILDRVDSLCFTAPIVYHLLRITS